MQKNFKKAIFGVNDVYSLAPKTLTYWSSENSVSPKEITINSNYTIKAECPECSYKWETRVNKLVEHPRCSSCRETKLVVGINDIATKYPELAKRFTIDSPVKANEMTLRTYKKAKVSCKFCSNTELRYVRDYRGYCKRCVNRFVSRENSVAVLRPEILDSVSSKETLDLFTVPVHSTFTILFNCERGHEYPQKITSWSTGSGCIVCLNILIIEGVNDLSTLLPEVAKLFSVNSPIKPTEIAPMSGKKALFECNKGHEWESIIANVSKGSRCEKCARAAVISKKELEVLEFFKKLDLTVVHSDRKIISPYELDIVVPDLKIAFEVNGDYWHSDELILKSRGMKAKEWHSYKKESAFNVGYRLYFIWESDWNNSLKEVQESISNLIFNGVESPLLSKLESNNR